MRRIEARRRKASAFRVRFSKSLARRRQRLNHAKVRSTTQSRVFCAPFWSLCARHTTRARVGGTAGGSRPDGYLRIGIGYQRYLAHRLAWLYMTGAWPKKAIDHIN